MIYELSGPLNQLDRHDEQQAAALASELLRQLSEKGITQVQLIEAPTVPAVVQWVIGPVRVIAQYSLQHDMYWAVARTRDAA